MADLQVKEIIKQMISYSDTEQLDVVPESNLNSSFISYDEQDEQTFDQILET